MPNKPDKYGFKFWLLVEVESKYVVKILPYLGKLEKEGRQGRLFAVDVLLQLTEDKKNHGYNITCDNFFYFHGSGTAIESLPNISSWNHKN